MLSIIKPSGAYFVIDEVELLPKYQCSENVSRGSSIYVPIRSQYIAIERMRMLLVTPNQLFSLQCCVF
jgi:hypothetical protein